ncbi:nicotinate-nucleotide adenylyltransferase [Bacillus seohaeanensis]|jgi:nicotinate-nucleotide adenylyltransferase|uniref:Probable nicotinate-nucleotide adenylyltransferase n=1 Tax=Bacillus seohaeanensis TaxID=284580 RepID=A0ABW5RML3_9BACI
MTKKVGLLGGTFNPPHIGHLIIADQVLQKCELDEIRFMPNHVPPHKVMENHVSGDQRVQMLSLATEAHPFFSIELIELEREGTSYTIDTIKLLKEREPLIDFSFIIGGDMIEYLPKWHKIDELLSLINFIGVNRPNYTSDTTYNIKMVEVPSIDISSSLIREHLKNRRSIRYLIPQNVLDYIEEEHIYGEG